MKIVLIVLVVLVLLYLFLIAPRLWKKPDRTPYMGIHYAHRGLFDNTSDAPENSLAAFRKAVEAGYGIELDVQLSKDKKLVVFHDATLKRMCGVKGNVWDYTLEELKQFKLADSEEKIPTFDQVLSLVNGKVPLLIELKDQPNNGYVDKVINRLKSYKGEFAIQSFNPFYIKRVKKLAPKVLRGILGTKTYSKGLKLIKRLVIKNMSLNFVIKPDFISYSFEDLPLSKCKVKNTPVITWTITNESDYKKVKPFAKNIIFENFIPTK
jgi:glycerophosphoryl diester phosphodiesterase